MTTGQRALVWVVGIILPWISLRELIRVARGRSDMRDQLARGWFWFGVWGGIVFGVLALALAVGYLD